MPPRKRADEAVTTEDTVAAVANDTDDDPTTTAIIEDLATTQELVLRQEEMIQRLAEQVEHLSQTASDDPPADPGPAPEDFVAPVVPDGHKRYASRFGELTMIKTPGENLMLNGKAIRQKADYVDFTGGVFQTTEYNGPTPLPELIEWMESHPDFNATFWVDDYAIRRMSTVEIQQGVKSTIATPRAPLAAPMQ